MEPQKERLQAELDILQTMYPDQIKWDSKAQDLNYTLEHGVLTLRLSDKYLVSELPVVISAHSGKIDIGEEMRQVVRDYDLGAEILDALVLAFNDIVELKIMEQGDSPSGQRLSKPSGYEGEMTTVVIWLHHLLNTNKRKHCLSPPAGVTGVTKPGYPGVLIYAGIADAVDEHVRELKQLNWAAFQVRLEIGEAWSFAHGDSVIEVESMGELVAELGDKKEVFMEAMRMR